MGGGCRPSTLSQGSSAAKCCTDCGAKCCNNVLQRFGDGLAAPRPFPKVQVPQSPARSAAQSVAAQCKSSSFVCSIVSPAHGKGEHRDRTWLGTCCNQHRASMPDLWHCFRSSWPPPVIDVHDHCRPTCSTHQPELSIRLLNMTERSNPRSARSITSV